MLPIKSVIPPLFPEGPKTDYAHPKCYLGETNDCSRKLSKEHYISKSVLRSIRGGLQVSGGFWPAATSKEVSAENLVSKILCTRHNRALSPLDAVAGELFEAVAKVYDDFKAGSSSTGNSLHICSGLMLELWCLKVIWGVHLGGITTAKGSKTRDSYELDTSMLMKAFSSRRLDYPCGLYAYGQRQLVRTGVSVKPIGTHDPQRIGGVEIGIHGVRFDVIFDPSAVYEEQVERSQYRPQQIIFRNAVCSHVIMLTWPFRRPLEPELVITVVG